MLPKMGLLLHKNTHTCSTGNRLERGRRTRLSGTSSTLICNFFFLKRVTLQIASESAFHSSIKKPLCPKQDFKGGCYLGRQFLSHSGLCPSSWWRKGFQRDALDSGNGKITPKSFSRTSSTYVVDRFMSDFRQPHTCHTVASFSIYESCYRRHHKGVQKRLQTV